MKKWETPKLNNLNIYDTKHGAWRYFYQCTSVGTGSCIEYFGSYSKLEDYPCGCGNGIVTCIAKKWNDYACLDPENCMS